MLKGAQRVGQNGISGCRAPFVPAAVQGLVAVEVPRKLDEAPCRCVALIWVYSVDFALDGLLLGRGEHVGLLPKHVISCCLCDVTQAVM